MEREKRRTKRYEQLFRMPLSENKFLIISRTPDNKISMAQQIKTIDNDGQVSYFIIKNAFLFLTDEIFNKFKEGVQEIEIKKEVKK